MKRKVLDKRTIAAIRRRRFMVLADNGGERPTPPEPQWNMRVVAHPDDGYEMPQQTGAFTLVKQDGDEYFYQHDGSSSTGDNVLYDESTHWGVESVTFKNCEHITSIDNRFLQKCRVLVSLDISPLQNVTRVGDYFLCDCRSITPLDISPLQNVTRVGNFFLYQCLGLTSLDLSLPNITRIGTYFLYNCPKLTSIKLHWTTIPTTSSMDFMLGVPKTCNIEVPCEALSTYKTTSPWSSRASYIVGDC